jgi:hypothetical protein
MSDNNEWHNRDSFNNEAPIHTPYQVMLDQLNLALAVCRNPQAFDLEQVAQNLEAAISLTEGKTK